MDGERIRLLGVDAPELGDRPECFAAEARALVDAAVGGRAVDIELDPTRCRPPDVAGCRGDFGRLLGYVHYVDADGQPAVLNEVLLLTGHAAVLRGAARFRHRDSDAYDALEQSAARAGRGLWACP